ncbi:MAG TPA: hypothetical protein VMZ69_06655 [Saprospiraceae bacterium]|nr:hypothetical protein [Saprospiraceae bacterium]
MTKKEIIERGYIDQYVLGLTTDEENSEVERMANLYPEIQERINDARHRICSNFNRNLTQPALRSSLLTKRRVMLWSALLVSFFSIGFCFLCKEHFSLQETYSMQCEQLAREQQKLTQLASFSKMANEQANFLHAPATQRIKLKGVDKYPEAEVMVFHCENTGKMMLRVIDLPELPSGQHYEVWSQEPGKESQMVGQLVSPIRYDSLYTLSPVLHCATLEMKSVDPYTMFSLPVCMATLTN